MPNVCDANGLLPIELAKQLIADTVTASPSCVARSALETSSLKDALDRVVSDDIHSPINVPAYDNSAMDGYALRFEDVAKNNTLVQAGKSLAGHPFTGHMLSGQCVQVMTGAPIPEGADTVVMQENTERLQGANQQTLVKFLESVTKGSAIRPCGNDIAEGRLLFEMGHRLTPIDIGLLASLGINSVPVYRKLKVAIFSTGDELLAAGEAAQDGRIYDSNRPMLAAMLQRRGIEVLDLGIIADQKEKIRETFERANDFADCVISSGGVSVGEADYTREVLEEYGKVDFWKLAMKPGKPLAFGRLKNSIFFGLPGNPVSSAVTFDQIAAPALDLMAGCKVQSLPQLPAIAASEFKKRSGRTDFQRAFYFTNNVGELMVKASGSQSSGVLSSFFGSNCYVILERSRDKVSAGETVTIQAFSAGIM